MFTDKQIPRPGDRLTHRFRKGAREVFADVVSVDQKTGKVAVRVGATIYPSLTAAAEAETGYPTNGWIFWGLKKMKWQPFHLETDADVGI